MSFLNFIANKTQSSFCSFLCLQSCTRLPKLFHIAYDSQNSLGDTNAAFEFPSEREGTDMQKVQLSDVAGERML